MHRERGVARQVPDRRRQSLVQTLRADSVRQPPQLADRLLEIGDCPAEHGLEGVVGLRPLLGEA